MVSDMGGDSISIKFDGSNYGAWCFYFQFFVEGKGLWGYIDGTEPKPEATDAKGLKQWKIENARIVSWILGSVDVSIGIPMRRFKTAKEMWDYLSKVYQETNLSRKFQIECDIFTYGQEDRKIQEYYAGFMTLWAKYEQAQLDTITSHCCIRAIKKLNDERKVMQFLMKLRPEYEVARTNILNRISSPDMDIVLSELLREETRILTKATMEGGVMAKVLLHGTLHVTIYEVDRFLPEGWRHLFHKLVENKKNGVKSVKVTGNLYATIDLENARVAHTRRLVEYDHRNPQWNESFHIYCAHMTSHVAFSIKEDDPIGTTVVGRAFLPVEKILGGEEVDEWLQIMNKSNKPIHGGSKVHVKVRFSEVGKDSNWSSGIRTEFPGVPHTFFGQRKGCKVTLYQDAHIPNDFIPKIDLSEGKHYEGNKCWEDIFDAIYNAKHLIYITGWSVYTEITLIRDLSRPKSERSMTLGELLKRKADEGVRVLMLVWDDRTSIKLIKETGLMGTHDEETEDYFHDTKVHCVLCPRNPDNGHTFVEEVEIATMFTHHQKMVVVDSQNTNGASEQQRRIVSFIGGLDLCDGRYDTPIHSNFRTLGTVHHNDFHQPSFHGASIDKGGPREPWHDIHCKLEGPIAWDVLYNFEQRWQKQGGKNLLVKIRKFKEIFVPPSPVMYPEDHETWNVQLFRSIDGGAAFGFPDSPEDAARVGLISGKDQTIDRSIQDAYINAIRRAKNFIYIENQYFLGSSFDWNTNDLKVKEIEALHLIPKELSLKIVSKIEAGERFTVYIVIPMWPEGEPASKSVQAILNWQTRTMDMMYRDIVRALRSKGLVANPKDYLSFFCLGNREMKDTDEYVPAEKPDHGSVYSRAQQSRRFMIYIHAKMMIVDDEYIIIGSANINQRSMDGARDSEIAMGGYQPYHLSTKQPARGQIHGLRMSLWYEHLGLLDNSFLQPENLECVQLINNTAKKYWDLYTRETLDCDLPGHLLCYPIDVTENGEVTELSDSIFFPDTKARVLGSKPESIPPIITT